VEAQQYKNAEADSVTVNDIDTT